MSRERRGLLGEVREIASGSVRMVRTRLELLAIECGEQKALALRQIVVACAAIALLGLGVLMAAVAAALAMPPDWREGFFAIVACAFLATGGAGIAWLAVSSRTTPFFADTIGVLARDERALRGGDD
jgi:uncharacterized membrane protein YqjE